MIDRLIIAAIGVVFLVAGFAILAALILVEGMASKLIDDRMMLYCAPSLFLIYSGCSILSAV